MTQLYERSSLVGKLGYSLINRSGTSESRLTTELAATAAQPHPQDASDDRQHEPSGQTVTTVSMMVLLPGRV